MEREIEWSDWLILEIEIGYRALCWLDMETEEGITAAHPIFRKRPNG